MPTTANHLAQRRLIAGSLLRRYHTSGPFPPESLSRRGFLHRRLAHTHTRALSLSLPRFLSLSLSLFYTLAFRSCLHRQLSGAPLGRSNRCEPVQEPGFASVPVAFTPRVQMSATRRRNPRDQHQPVPRSRVDTNTRGSAKSRGDRNGRATKKKTKKKRNHRPTRYLHALLLLLKLCGRASLGA